MMAFLSDSWVRQPHKSIGDFMVALMIVYEGNVGSLWYYCSTGRTFPYRHSLHKVLAPTKNFED